MLPVQRVGAVRCHHPNRFLTTDRLVFAHYLPGDSSLSGNRLPDRETRAAGADKPSQIYARKIRVVARLNDGVISQLVQDS